MRGMRLPALVCVVLLLLAACGKKGPLYLPAPDAAASESR